MFIAVAPVQGPRKPYTERGTFVQVGLGAMTFLHGDPCATVLSSLGQIEGTGLSRLISRSLQLNSGAREGVLVT